MAEAEKRDLTGSEIRALRARLGLSKQAFGALIGVSHMTVYRWERDQTSQHPVFAEKLRALSRRAR